MVLCRIAVGASLYQLRFEAQHFFLVPASFGCAPVRLRRSQLSLGAGGLRPYAGIIQNQQQSALLDGVAFLDQNAPHIGRDRSVGLEVVDGLDFSVGGNQTADRGLLDDGSSHRHRVIAAGDETNQNKHTRQNRQRRYPPTPRPASRTVSIQCHAEKRASFNVYHPGAARAGKWTLRTYLFRCAAPTVCLSGESLGLVVGRRVVGSLANPSND